MYLTYKSIFSYVFLHTFIFITFCLRNCCDDCNFIGGRLIAIMLLYLTLEEECNYWTFCIIYRHTVRYEYALSVILSVWSCSDEINQFSVTLVKFSFVNLKICIIVFRCLNDCFSLINFFSIACLQLISIAGSTPVYIFCAVYDGIFL